MRINLISTPRNVSTALMYSFAQRADMSVIDEPFYGHFLTRSGADHPGRDEVLAKMPLELEDIAKSIKKAHKKKHLFIKNMAHHLQGIDLEMMKADAHVIFIRNPKELITSFAKIISDPAMEDLGIAKQLELFESLKEKGKYVVVFDSAALIADPTKALQSLCTAMNIPWDKKMLKWKAGPRPEDGVWAQYWYKNVHKSTGFRVQQATPRELPKRSIPVYKQARPIYEELAAEAIK